MKNIFFLLLLLCTGVFAQTKTKILLGSGNQITAYAATAGDSVTYAASGCGAPTINMTHYMTARRGGAYYMDTCTAPATLYLYTPSTNSWSTVSASTTTIYTGDGTLSGNRTVNMNNHSLTFDNGGSFIVNSNTGVYQFANLNSITNISSIATWSGSNLSKSTFSSVADSLQPYLLSGDTSFTWSVDSTVNAPPVGTGSGSQVRVGTSPSGVFIGHNNQIATSDGVGGFTYATATAGDLLYDANTDLVSKWNGSVWTAVGRAAIHQGLDRFGAPMKIGTGDPRAFGIWTNNLRRFNITSGGIISFGRGVNEYFFPTTNSAGALTNDGAGNLTWTAAGAGTVISVAATVVNTGLAVSGSPVTTSGTLAFTWTGAVQGDLPYFSGTNTLTFLNKSTTANQYLKNSGTSNNPAWGTIAASDIGSGAALTKTDDTNVTLTLGGTPSASLLAATSLTLGWTGTLAYSRFVSGAGLSVTGRSANSSGVQADIVGTNNTVLRVSGSVLGFGAVDISTAQITGTLPIANGGTNITTYTTGDILYASATNVLSKLPIGTTRQKLGVVGGIPAWIDSTASAGGASLTSTQVGFGDGSNLLSGSANLTYASSALTVNNAATIGTTTTTGLLLSNSIAAAAGAQQVSPALRFLGRGWKTNATAASQTVTWDMDVLPVQGAANPSSTFRVVPNINGSATSASLTFTSSGLLTVNASNTSTDGILINGGNLGVQVAAANTSLITLGNAYNLSTYTSWIASTGNVLTTSAFSGYVSNVPMTSAITGSSGTYKSFSASQTTSTGLITVSPALIAGYTNSTTYNNTNASSVVYSLAVGYDNLFTLGLSVAKDITTVYGERLLVGAADANPTGKIGTYIGSKIDTVDNNFFRTTNIGYWQNGTNAVNIFDGNTVIGNAASATPTATLQVKGSFAPNYVGVSGTYNILTTDYTVECTANTFTVTLPTAVGHTKVYNIVNSGAGTITIATTSSQTFVNVVATPTTLTLAAPGTYSVQSNGANWMVLNINGWIIIILIGAAIRPMVAKRKSFVREILEQAA